MDFLKEFSKQFSSVARTVTEKSKEGAETNRLNSELRSAQEALDELYRRYGKVCYDMGLGQDVQKEAEALAVRIRATLLQLKELTEQRDAAREVRRCPSCGMVHSIQARYCSACGKKLPEDAPKPEPMQLGEYCPACGAAREGNEIVCPVCGAAFEDKPAPTAAPAVAPEPEPRGPDVEEPDHPMED